MTRTASQKARAKAKRANAPNNNKPIVVVQQPQRAKRNNNSRASMTGNVSSRGSVVTVGVPERRSVIRPTYFNVVGDVMFKGRKGLKIRARDYISSVSMLNSMTVVGTTALNVIICPTEGAFLNTRLGRFCSLYEKYVFTNIDFQVDTGAGSGVNGNYIIAYDKDPSDPTPLPGDTAIREFSAWEGTQMFPAGVNGSIKFPLSDPQDFYYTNSGNFVSDERLYAQGQVYIAYGNQRWSTDISLGLFMEYEIILFDPELGSLTSELRMNNAVGYTPSNTPSQGWPAASFPLAAIQTIGEGIRDILDSTGTFRGLKLEQGQYFLEQVFGNNVAAQTIGSAILTAIDPSKQAQAVISNLENIISVVGGTAFRTDRITVPVGGATLFGTLNVSTATTGAGIRIFQPALSGTIV